MRASLGFRCLIAWFAICCVAKAATPEELDDLLKSGSAFIQQADYAHAIPILRRATQLAPQSPLANFLLGEALLKSGQPAEAIAPLEIAAQGRPQDEMVEGYLGDAAMEQKEFALAAEAFESAIVRSPHSEQALLWWTDYSMERFRTLGLWLRGTQRGKAALLWAKAGTAGATAAVRLDLLQHAAAMDPAMSGIWGELGIAQAQLGMMADAQASLKKAKEQQPEASSTLELEAYIEAVQGHWSQAEKNLTLLESRSQAGFKKLLAAWPQKLVPEPGIAAGPVWQCIRQGSSSCQGAAVPAAATRGLPAEALFREGRWEQLAAEPSPAEGAAPLEWFWRGAAFEQIGDCRRAIPALERGFQAKPETAASLLTVCYEWEVVAFSERLNTEGKQGAVHQVRGDILLSIKNNPSGAVVEYTEALSLKPNDPDLMEKLAESYFAAGDLDRARESAQKALDQNPHRELALRVLIRIAMSERDYPGALTLLDRLAKIEPEDGWMRVQQGTAYAETGHPEEAVRLLKAELDSGYPDEKGAMHAVLAGQLRKLGRESEAKVATDEAIKLADSFQERSQNSPTIDDHQ